VTFELVPNFRTLGPKLGKDMPLVKQTLAKSDGGKLQAQLEKDGFIELNLPSGAVRLSGEDIQIRLQAKPDYAASAAQGQVVVLDTRVDDGLRREGLAREVINRLQRARKTLDLAYEARIRIGYSASGELLQALQEHAGLIAGETLAVELAAVSGDEALGDKQEVDVDGAPLTFWVSVVS
jgi:isoleucyl-tRNA synthetase